MPVLVAVSGKVWTEAPLKCELTGRTAAIAEVWALPERFTLLALLTLHGRKRASHSVTNCDWRKPLRSCSE